MSVWESLLITTAAKQNGGGVKPDVFFPDQLDPAQNMSKYMQEEEIFSILHPGFKEAAHDAIQVCRN